MKKGHYTLIDTWSYLDLEKKDYLECNEGCIEDEEDVTDDEVNEWIERERQFEIEDFWDNLKYCKTDCDGFIIEGVLGLWNGRPEVGPIHTDTLYEAMRKCIGDSIMDMVVTKEGNRIEVSAYHHDGTNNFTIYPLSEKGEDIYQRLGKVSILRSVNLGKLPEYLW